MCYRAVAGGRHQLPLSMMKIRLEILVGVGEIVVEPCDDFPGLGVMDDPAAAALLGMGVEGLQHRFRHAGKSNVFVHLAALLLRG